ncbi:HmuY protein [Porphyromonadaceae bacterium KH3R12]|nr:HmuY protein [Porphyromonadaceae bacterium KH3R12]
MKVNLFNSKFLLASTIMVSLTLGLGSCEKDEPETQKEEVKTVQIDSSSKTQWVYFSFEKGTLVTVENDKVAESLNWDLGFLWSYARTNSGESGQKGKGGVISTDKLTLEEVTSLPASTEFTVDATVNVPKTNAQGEFIMPPMSYDNLPGNTVLSSWVSSGRPPYIYNNTVYVIRTADGNYAKIIMKSFEDKNGDAGVITMDYVYPFVPQP